MLIYIYIKLFVVILNRDFSIYELIKEIISIIIKMITLL